MPTSKDFRGSGNHRQLFRPYWGPTSVAQPLGKWTGKTRISKTPHCWKAIYQAPAPHNTCGSCWLGTAQQFHHDMRGEGGSQITSKSKQGHTYTNPRPRHYLTHVHSRIMRAGNNGQRFHQYWGSTAWHGHWSVTGETCVKRPFPAEVSPLSASSTQHMWELLAQGTARQLYHDMRGEGRSRVWCMCAPCFNLSFENSELYCSTT